MEIYWSSFIEGSNFHKIIDANILKIIIEYSNNLFIYLWEKEKIF